MDGYVHPLTSRTHATRGVVSSVLLAAIASACASAPAPLHNIPVSIKTFVAQRASGTFNVKVTPQAADDYADATALGRMTLDKQFTGDLQATSKGQMLTGMSSVKGSAGYVAIERVSGVLAGRRGTFVLQHSGTMTRGTPSLVITVVPDSGTEALTGLSGTMVIDVTGGRHSYTFDYTLPNSP